MENAQAVSLGGGARALFANRRVPIPAHANEKKVSLKPCLLRSARRTFFFFTNDAKNYNFNLQAGFRANKPEVYFRNEHYNCILYNVYIYITFVILIIKSQLQNSLGSLVYHCYTIVPTDKKALIPNREGIPSSVHMICRDV